MAKYLDRISRIRIGWVRARIELLEPAPVQCYRCWEYGHLKAQCRSEKDRAGRCYRCGSEGHKVMQCGEAPKCMLCVERGTPYKHRMGGRECLAKVVREGGDTLDNETSTN